MNVLLIAPDVGLESAKQEVRAVSLALNATLLNGTVTRRDVLDTLHAKHWDVIWFATHGDEHGIQLSDAPLPTGDLAAIVRNSRATLLVLNSCSSRNVARDIHYDLDRGINIICTQAAADDITAYQTGALLARNLAQGLSVRDAYERSRPGNDSLYFLFSADGQRGDNNDEFDALLQIMRNEFSKLWRAIEDSERRVTQRIQEVERKVEQKIESAVQNLETKFETRFVSVQDGYVAADKRIYAIEYLNARPRVVDAVILGVVAVAMAVLVLLYIYNQVTP